MVKTPRRKKQQPSRMDRYANLGEIKHTPKKRPRQHKHFQWFWNLSRKKKILVCFIPVVILLIAIPLITYFIYAQDISDRERLMNRNNTGIVLTDVNGKTFYSVGRAEHRNLVPLDQISDNMKHALIASEDKDFYKHGGFNIFSIFRAAITRHGGGSTITQQLVKNTLLTDEKSYLRKYQELFMAIAVEQNYTKDEILTMYLNSVFYGENAFGIEEAAKTYFGKEPKDLDLAESAMLVGLLPAPSAYSPISGNATYAKQRQETV
ncbi:MAG: biosynthetic peptidoglycan transglycosylase, partial [Candidatus Saccharimonas sp.]